MTDGRPAAVVCCNTRSSSTSGLVSEVACRRSSGEHSGESESGRPAHKAGSESIDDSIRATSPASYGMPRKKADSQPTIPVIGLLQYHFVRWRATQAQ